MVTERRLARISEQIRKKVAEVVAQDVSDPRLGFVTVTRVQVDRELLTCKVFWSCLGGDKERRLTERALDHARGFIQREMARILTTRTVPSLRFYFDESIAGAIRLHNLIDEAVGKDLQSHEPPPGEEPEAEGPEGEEPRPEEEPPPGSGAG